MKNVFNTKKWLCAFLVLLMTIGLIPLSVPAAAYEIGEVFYDEESRLYYKIESLSPSTENVFLIVSVVKPPTASGIYPAGDYTIPQNVAYKGTYCAVAGFDTMAFQNSDISSVNIISSVYFQAVTYHGFSGCKNLKTVTLGNNITNIQVYAFKDCTALKSITIPQYVDYMGAYCFANCTSLESVTYLYPHVDRSIDETAFEGSNPTFHYKYATPEKPRFEGTAAKWDGIGTSYVKYHVTLHTKTPDGMLMQTQLYTTDTSIDLADKMVPGGEYYFTVRAMLPDIVFTDRPSYQTSDYARSESVTVPIISNATAERTSPTELTVSFTSSQAGYVYYSLNGSNPEIEENLYAAGNNTMVIPNIYDGIEYIDFKVKAGGFESNTVQLAVPAINTPTAPIIIQDIEDIYVYEGEDVTFELKVVSSPEATYKWYRGYKQNDIIGVVTQETEFTTNTKTYTNVTVLGHNNTNHYCIVSNSEGTVRSSTAYIHVLTRDNAELSAVSVDGTAGVIHGDTVTLDLPDTASLPTEASQLSITTQDPNAVISTPVTDDGGETWSFAVTAADGTQKAYTLLISAKENTVLQVHCSCGLSTNDCTDPTHSDTVFGPWRMYNSVPDSGSYYLTSSISYAPDNWAPGEDLHICLNGKALVLGENAKKLNFSVCDCKGDGRLIYGDYEYGILSDGTASIAKYNGEEAVLTLPDSILGMTVTVVGESSFENNKDLKKVTFPDTIKRIERWAFRDASNLWYVSLNEGLEYIGEGCLERMEITSVTIPDTVTEIGVWAFADNNLTSLTLGKGLKTIGYVAFKGCTAEIIVIPEGVTSIGYDAFVSCTEATTITVLGNPTVGERAFGNATVVYGTNLGDLSGDGNVNAADVNLMKRIMTGDLIPNETAVKAGDINNDTKMDIIDLNLLKRMLVGTV